MPFPVHVFYFLDAADEMRDYPDRFRKNVTLAMQGGTVNNKRYPVNKGDVKRFGTGKI